MKETFVQWSWLHKYIKQDSIKGLLRWRIYYILLFRFGYIHVTLIIDAFSHTIYYSERKIGICSTFDCFSQMLCNNYYLFSFSLFSFCTEWSIVLRLTLKQKYTTLYDYSFSVFSSYGQKQITLMEAWCI